MQRLVPRAETSFLVKHLYLLFFWKNVYNTLAFQTHPYLLLVYKTLMWGSRGWTQLHQARLDGPSCAQDAQGTAGPRLPSGPEAGDVFASCSPSISALTYTLIGQKGQQRVTSLLCYLTALSQLGVFAWWTKSLTELPAMLLLIQF